MANFLASLPRTLNFEAAYLGESDPNGEYFKGLSKKNHPEWKGWLLISAFLQQNPGKVDELNSQRGLLQCLRDYYKTRFWDRFSGDHLADQDLADEMFDAMVNQGIVTAAKMLQRAVNALKNRQGELLYPALAVDGILGAKTLAAVEILGRSPQGSAFLLQTLRSLRAHAYVSAVERLGNLSPYSTKWLNRIGDKSA